MNIVKLLCVGYVGISPQAIRMTLEYIGYQVHISYIATAQQLIDALSDVPQGAYVVIDAHGTEEGLVLEELAEEVAAQQPYVNFVTAQNFREFLSLPECTVVNLGCVLGTQDYGDAFLEGGCTAYIGAIDYPDGSSALVYAQMLFYFLFNHQLSLSDAHERARNIDDDTRQYTLYTPQK